jgi:hypothetical protein
MDSRPPRRAVVAAGAAVVGLVATGLLIMPHEIHAPHIPQASEFVTVKVLERLMFELTLGKAGMAATVLLTLAEWISALRS